MEWLNYHHLRYFWTVARKGGVRKAAEELHVSQPSISAQLRLLEESLGQKLFRRSGRNLVLTETGQLVLNYADEIFSAGRELMNAVKQRPGKHPVRLNIGLTDAFPKLIAWQILHAAFRSESRFTSFAGRAKSDRWSIICRRTDSILCSPTSRPRAP